MSATQTDLDLAAHLRDHADRYLLGNKTSREVEADLLDLYDLALEVGADDVAEGIEAIEGKPAECARALYALAAELNR